MTDPWSIHPDLSCPTCHVVGKVISRTPDDDENYQICVECGMTWLEGPCVRPGDIKEMRLHWSRLHEGRPYEPPKHEFEPVKIKIDWSEYDRLLKEIYDKPVSFTGHTGDAIAKALGFSDASLWSDAWKFDGAPEDILIQYMPGDEWLGSMRVVAVDQATGTITVEYEKK